MTESAPQASGPIVATAGRYYRNTRYILLVLFVAVGIWCVRDGFYKWPEDNRKLAEWEARDAQARAEKNQALIDQLVQERKQLQPTPHNNLGIRLNQALAFILPLAGVGLVGWALYRSRGSYRLEDDVLSVPGHPPMHLSQIREVDKSLWDRKGVATITYDVPNSSQTGKFKLDDFIYSRPETDRIMQRIEEHMAAMQPPQASPEPEIAETQEPTSRENE